MILGSNGSQKTKANSSADSSGSGAGNLSTLAKLVVSPPVVNGHAVSR